MRGNSVQLKEDIDWLAPINHLYRMIIGSSNANIWQSNASNALEELQNATGKIIERNFDGFVKWFKDLFKGEGIFAKIGKGIGGIIRAVHNWLQMIVEKIPGTAQKIPGVGMPMSQMIAIGLVCALTLIAFYKIFKGLLGSDKDDDESRYSESINAGNKIVIDFYNLTEHISYQYKYHMLSEGVFGGFFSFIGKTIRKAFKFVGEIVHDAYKGAKKHPLVALIVLTLCFFVCFCMKGPISSNIKALFHWTPVEEPGMIGKGVSAVKGAFSKNIAHPIAKSLDKVSTIANNPVGWGKELIGWPWVSENIDVDIYVNKIFEEL